METQKKKSLFTNISSLPKSVRNQYLLSGWVIYTLMEKRKTARDILGFWINASGSHIVWDDRHISMSLQC